MPTEAILSDLHALAEAPWSDIRGKPIDARWLARQLGKYDVKPKVIRVDDATPRGYEATDLHDPWSRYVAAPEDPFGKLGHTHRDEGILTFSSSHQGTATSATGATLSLAGLPGRCPRCEHHVPTQGHAPDCPEAP